MHHNFERVLSQRFKVQIGNFHDHFKCDKMNNTMLDSVLIGKKVNANALTEKSGEDLVQS